MGITSLLMTLTTLQGSTTEVLEITLVVIPCSNSVRMILSNVRNFAKKLASKTVGRRYFVKN